MPGSPQFQLLKANTKAARIRATFTHKKFTAVAAKAHESKRLSCIIGSKWQKAGSSAKVSVSLSFPVSELALKKEKRYMVNVTTEKVMLCRSNRSQI